MSTDHEHDVIATCIKGTTLILNCTQTIDHYITYSAITSSPEVSYSSILSTVRCWPVTSGKSANGTFVQWTANFSGDADAGECTVTLSLFSLTISSPALLSVPANH